MAAMEYLMKENSRVRKIAFVADHLPRKCGIATFTSDLLAAVATAPDPERTSDLPKQCPMPRPIMAHGRIIEIPQVGGLHHRYERVVA
jgi:hypothetical protein